MQKFSLDNELNRIQNKQVQQTNTLQRVLLSVFVLLFVATISLNASYSVDLVEMDTSNTHRIHVEVVNGVKDNYGNCVLSCDNEHVKYSVKERLLYGNSIEKDVNCTLIFDNKSAKSAININELKRVNDNAGISYYFDSLATNNYITVNGILFRIISIKSRFSITLSSIIT